MPDKQHRVEEAPHMTDEEEREILREKFGKDYVPNMPAGAVPINWEEEDE